MWSSLQMWSWLRLLPQERLMRILLSGASGFIGKPLSLFLSTQGHTVIPLIRHFAPHSIQWDPDQEVASLSDFEGFEAVIHLAGEPLTLTRWTEAKKRKIFISRVQGTKALSHLLSRLTRPPQLFLSASAIGYYGDRGEENLTEESSAGPGFLAHTCQEWEKASSELKQRGIRTAQTRFGLVLGPHGGLLSKMLPAYKFGLGGRLGSGQQWISWVALEDLIRAIGFILTHSSLSGPINITSPQPIRQQDFAATLAHLLHRPHFFALPAPLLHLLFGQSADELLLSSTRAFPAKLLASNFPFRYPDLRAVILRALN